MLIDMFRKKKKEPYKPVEQCGSLNAGDKFVLDKFINIINQDNTKVEEGVIRVKTPVPNNLKEIISIYDDYYKSLLMDNEDEEPIEIVVSVRRDNKTVGKVKLGIREYGLIVVDSRGETLFENGYPLMSRATLIYNYVLGVDICNTFKEICETLGLSSVGVLSDSWFQMDNLFKRINEVTTLAIKRNSQYDGRLFIYYLKQQSHKCLTNYEHDFILSCIERIKQDNTDHYLFSNEEKLYDDLVYDNSDYAELDVDGNPIYDKRLFSLELIKKDGEVNYSNEFVIDPNGIVSVLNIEAIPCGVPILTKTTVILCRVLGFSVIDILAEIIDNNTKYCVESYTGGDYLVEGN